MARRHGFWFSVGQIIGEMSALSETARTAAVPVHRPSDRRAGRAASARDPGRPAEARRRTSPLSPELSPEGARAAAPTRAGPPLHEGRDSLEWFLTRTATSVVTDRAERWLWGRRPGPGRLLRAAAAGAGAAAAGALVARVVQFGARRPDEPMDGGPVDPEEPAELVEELLAGAGRGLVYASAVEPLLPGPPALRGAAFGTAEYLAGPWGGVTSHLGALAPQRRIPVLRQLLEPSRVRPGSAVECLTEGTLLGALYGSPPDREEKRSRE